MYKDTWVLFILQANLININTIYTTKKINQYNFHYQQSLYHIHNIRYEQYQHFYGMIKVHHSFSLLYLKEKNIIDFKIHFLNAKNLRNNSVSSLLDFSLKKYGNLHNVYPMMAFYNMKAFHIKQKSLKLIRFCSHYYVYINVIYFHLLLYFNDNQKQFLIPQLQ